MHIHSVTISNFRCFGPTPETILLGPDLTALIGANGAGKSAFIAAIRKLFGASREDRSFVKADFNIASTDAEALTSKQAFIEVMFAFPELASSDTEVRALAERTVPHAFRHMCVGGVGGDLFARMRLEAVWEAASSFEDDITTKLFWVTTPDAVPFGSDDEAALDKIVVSAADRARIQLRLVPAIRDNLAVTQQALRQLLKRLERHGLWGDEQDTQAAAANVATQTIIDGLEATRWVSQTLQRHWSSLHDFGHLNEPSLQVDTRQVLNIIRSLSLKVGPGLDGTPKDIKDMSEGQISLMFLALYATLSELELALGEGAEPMSGFKPADLVAPALVIFAVEEPETHLAPFYLSRLISLIQALSAGPQAMALITSHSPSVLRRIEPSSVRHFRLCPETLSTRVRGIRMPSDDTEAEKFVRTAVLAHPEIYFSRLVILGEGDSERTVLPLLASALGTDLDPAFIAVAPLGGRFVNHLWRLLSDLEIPYLTLLDFDLGRFGGGPLRLKYAHDQLRKLNASFSPSWLPAGTDKSAYWHGLPLPALHQWMEWLEGFDVFFSSPIDLDYLLLTAWPVAYGVTPVSGVDAVKVESAVFGSKGAGMAAYTNLSWPSSPTLNEAARYEELFKSGSKPASHAMSLSTLSPADLARDCPPVLARLLSRARLAAGLGDANAVV